MNCPWCGSSRARQVWRNTEFRIAECEQCNLVYTSPQVRVDIYNDAYYVAYAAKETIDAQVFDRILERLGRLRAPGRLLDVGCGIGTFAARASARNWEAVGIDTSEAAVRAARVRYPQTTYVCGDWAQLKMERFDVIVLFDMLMYVCEPMAFLKGIREMLSPSGLVVIKAVHRPKSFLRALYWGLSPTRSRGHSLLFLPNSLYHFTPALLARLIEPLGFRVVDEDDISMQVPPIKVQWQERIVQFYGRLLTRLLVGSTHFVISFERSQ